MGMKRCHRCKTTENLYISARSVVCRPCNTIKQREKYVRRKQTITKAINRYEAEHPERRAAWRAATTIPKQPCEVCGDTNVHRHHPDPLEQETVTFLCPLHHKRAHMVI